MNPTVVLTQPAPNSVVVAGCSIALTANAQTQAPDTVASVQFFDGATSLGIDTTAPYAATQTNVGAGSHAYTAVVVDTGSNTATSATVGLTAIPLRTDMPEFASQVVFPDSVLNFWFNVASLLLNASRWRQMLPVAMELFVAHNAVLEALAIRGVAAGGLPGLSRGAISAEAIDKGNLSYDTSGTLELNGGNWNLTTYGSRFLRLARQFGAGPLQVGIGSNPNPLNAGAWSGPDCFPGFTNFGN